VFAEFEQIFAVKADRARLDARACRQDADDRTDDRRFAAARLANKA
jgi:hypothetical protein